VKVADYALTPYVRRRLKKPLGRLFPPSAVEEDQFRDALFSAPFVITVGDRVTETVGKLGRTPDLQIVDSVERRQRRQAPNVRFSRLYRAANPAGRITSEAVAAIDLALKGPLPARVLITGEEDLLALPAVALAPDGTALFYGQPGEGVVLVDVGPPVRESALRKLEAMKPRAAGSN
jgi:uncharacterized protein (UPF0218 family)